MDITGKVKRKSLLAEIDLLRAELRDELMEHSQVVKRYQERERELEVLLADAEARAGAAEKKESIANRVVLELKGMMREEERPLIRSAGELGGLRVQLRGRDERIAELEKELKAARQNVYRGLSMLKDVDLLDELDRRLKFMHDELEREARRHVDEDLGDVLSGT